MTIRRSKDELQILRLTRMLGEFKAWGVSQVLAARKLAGEGLITMIQDNADEHGIGHAVVAAKVRRQPDPAAWPYSHFAAAVSSENDPWYDEPKDAK